MALTIRYPILS